MSKAGRVGAASASRLSAVCEETREGAAEEAADVAADDGADPDAVDRPTGIDSPCIATRRASRKHDENPTCP